MKESVSKMTRKVYCVMGANSMPYARLAMQSLFENSLEPFELKIITDGEQDKSSILAGLQDLPQTYLHTYSVHAKPEIDELARKQFADFTNLLQFREGHPCWRKITDPFLMAEPGEEMVILDPDLYFPNKFSFESTPTSGVLLMWQPPSCLLPHDTVMNAYRDGIALAHHVDIGVAHARKNLDLAWLDRLIANLGAGKPIPRAMHVEAIVWAAIAMKEGGGYLDPRYWHCWRNSQWKRLALKLKVSGPQLLRVERFENIKCFHGGGPAKWWLPAWIDAGRMPRARELALSQNEPAPFEELTLDAYTASQRFKRLAGKLGYYKLMQR